MQMSLMELDCPDEDCWGFMSTRCERACQHKIDAIYNLLLYFGTFCCEYHQNCYRKQLERFNALVEGKETIPKPILARKLDAATSNFTIIQLAVANHQSALYLKQLEKQGNSA